MKPRLIGEFRELPRTIDGGSTKTATGQRPVAVGIDENAPIRDTNIPLRGVVQPINTFRAIKLATGLQFGLKSYVPAGQFRLLSRVKAERTRLTNDTDEQLAARFLRLKRSVATGDMKADQVKIKSLAICSEMAKRTLGLDPFDVQLLAAIELLDGAVAELGTGEGKTLVGALVAATRALDGRGVHVLTANPYLARRDAERLAPLYEGLHLSVGVSEGHMDAFDKRDAYAKDITYAFGTQVVWDWLDDQTWYRKSFQKMPPLAHCIIDEVDHVLGDAATEPIVLTGATEAPDTYAERQVQARMARDIVDQLEPSTSFEVFYERKRPRATLSSRGIDRLEGLIKKATGDETDESVWREDNVPLLHEIFKVVETRHEIVLDRDFIKNGDEVVLLDPNTDRPNPSARLRFNKLDSIYMRHDEEAPLDHETAGFITNQHFFPMYKSVAGMTATGEKMREEFGDIYGLRVSQIPPHRKSIRTDDPDRFFVHSAMRTMSAVVDVIESTNRGQPVLVATHDVAESEFISQRLSQPYLCLADALASSDRLLRAGLVQLDAGDSILSRIAELTTEPERKMLVEEIGHLIANDARGAEAIAQMLDNLGMPATTLIERGSINHRVLNAKTVEQEDEIVSAAGELRAVTVGTPMALIGTDIQYGPGVADVGGLRIVGIGHMENERKDDQLRGRTGRQGLPGSTAFYVAPEDDVFTYGAASRMRDLCVRLFEEQAPESTAHTGKWRSAIKHAQERNETDQQYRRRAITRFDSAIQAQRKSYVAERDEILVSEDLPDHLCTLVRDRAERMLLAAVAPSANADAMSSHAVRSEIRYYGEHDTVVPKEATKRILELVPGALVEEREMGVDHLLGALEIRLEAHIALASATQSARAERSRIMAPNEPFDPDINQWLRERVLSVTDDMWVSYLQDRDSARSFASIKAFGENDIFTAFVHDSARVFSNMQNQQRLELIDELTGVIDNMHDPLAARLGLVELGRSSAPDRVKREAAAAVLARTGWEPENIGESVICLDAIDILAGVKGGPEALLAAFDAKRGAGGYLAGYAVRRLEAQGADDAATAIRAQFEYLPTSRYQQLSRAIYWQFDSKKKIGALEDIAKRDDKMWLADLETWIFGQADQGADVDRAVKRTVGKLKGVKAKRLPTAAHRRHRAKRGSRNAG